MSLSGIFQSYLVKIRLILFFSFYHENTVCCDPALGMTRKIFTKSNKEWRYETVSSLVFSEILWGKTH
jgi:hypothetical protein